MTEKPSHTTEHAPDAATTQAPNRNRPFMRTATAILLSALILGVMFLSYRQPLSADDYANSLVLHSHPSAYAFVAHYYEAWTGRATGMLLLWFALQHRIAFAALNGLAFAALVGLTFGLGLGRMPRWTHRDISVMAFLAVTYWFALPTIAETVFWVTGAVTYLWSAVLMLALAYPYRRWLETRPGPRARSWLVELAAGAGLLALGIATGLTHELVIFALAALFVVLLVYVARHEQIKAVPLRLWAGMVGLAIGGCALFLSPGNATRSATSGDSAVTLLGRASLFVTYVAKVLGSYLPKLYPWLLCVVIVAIPLAILTERGAAQRRWWGFSVAWTVAGLATLAPFVLDPAVALAAGQRTTIFVAVFLTVGAVSLLANGTSPAILDRLPSTALLVGTSLLLAIALVELAGSVHVADRISADVAARAQFVATEKSRGSRDVAVPPLETKPYRTVYYVDLEADPGYWLNTALASWYGVDSIRVDASLAATATPTP